jgi:hypothetical protein
LKWLKHRSDILILLYLELLWRPLGWYMSYPSPLNSCRNGSDRSGEVEGLGDASGRQFIAHMTVSKNSPLIDKVAIGGLFSGLPNKKLRMVERHNKVIFPAFKDYKAQVGDVLVVAAT